MGKIIQIKEGNIMKVLLYVRTEILQKVATNEQLPSLYGVLKLG